MTFSFEGSPVFCACGEVAVMGLSVGFTVAQGPASGAGRWLDAQGGATCDSEVPVACPFGGGVETGLGEGL